jgi:hypothetical protein
MKTIKINTEVIESFKPCQSRLDNWLQHYESFDGGILQFLDLKNITHNDKLWLFLRLLPEKYLGSIAADFAEEVVHIYERYNVDSSVLKAAIAAARGNNTNVAYAAANAAYAVARNIGYAYDAAYAAYDAAYAAYDATSIAAANAAANAIWAADDRDNMKKEQIEIMKKWLENTEKSVK